MRLSMRSALLIAGVTLLAPASAHATKTFSPTSLTFGATAVGTESAPQTVTYSSDALEIARTTQPFIARAGGDPCPPSGFCDFRFTTTCPVSPMNFAPGAQSCTFTVFFTPYDAVTPGTRSGALHATNGPPTVQLTGTSTVTPPTGGTKKCKKKKGRSSDASAARKKCKKKKRK